jgi:hypothetical protein
MTPHSLDNSPFKNIYDTYNGTIKELLADIESRYQKFPIIIYNEIRAVFDHIARCYNNDFSDKQIEKEVEKAEGHIKRIVFDSYKLLYVFQNKTFIKFEKKTKNVDLRSIDDRRFYDGYAKLRKEARINIKNAKKIESKNHQGAFELYKKAYDTANTLEDLIDKYSTQIWQTRAKHVFSIILRIIIWALLAIFTGLISDCIGLLNLIDKIFGK